MWTYNDYMSDMPSEFVVEEDVQKAEEALEAFRTAVCDLAPAILGGKPVANRQQRRAALGHRSAVDRTSYDSPRRCRTHPPPGRLVSTSPNQPNGPPRCAARKSGRPGNGVTTSRFSKAVPILGALRPSRS